MEDEDVLRPASKETRAWVQALTAKWPAMPAPAEPPRGLSPLYLLAVPVVMTYWFWAPWLFAKVQDLVSWLVAYVATGGGRGF